VGGGWTALKNRGRSLEKQGRGIRSGRNAMCVLKVRCEGIKNNDRIPHIRPTIRGLQRGRPPPLLDISYDLGERNDSLAS